MMADCPDCKSIINLSDENATRGEFYLKKYVELRRLVIELDGTMSCNHLSISGQNVYLLSHKSHAVIQKIKAFLGKEEARNKKICGCQKVATQFFQGRWWCNDCAMSNRFEEAKNDRT